MNSVMIEVLIALAGAYYLLTMLREVHAQPEITLNLISTSQEQRRVLPVYVIQ